METKFIIVYSCIINNDVQDYPTALREEFSSVEEATDWIRNHFMKTKVAKSLTEMRFEQVNEYMYKIANYKSLYEPSIAEYYTIVKRL